MTGRGAATAMPDMSSVPGVPSGALLAVRGLAAWYGRAQALFGLDFELAPGEVLALLGPNGAGKSSTLRALMGLVEARGEVAFAGRRIDAWPTWRRARSGIGYVPEDRRIFTELTVRENLLVGRAPARAGVWDEAALLELFPNLAEMLDRPAARMSGGEQQMLAVARSLIGNPALVLLDEPSEGIAPRVVEAMAAAVQAMKRKGVAVLLSEQNAAFADAVADRKLRLEAGRLI